MNMAGLSRSFIAAGVLIVLAVIASAVVSVLRGTSSGHIDKGASSKEINDSKEVKA